MIRPPILPALAAVAILAVVMALAVVLPKNNEERAAIDASNREAMQSAGIQDVSVDNVPFYYCSAATTPAKKSLVLLHGSTFTRDTWLDIGVMQDLCSNGSLEVLAISRYGTDHEQLKSFLDSLESSGYVSFPVALVTPSASSHPVVDWLANGDAQEMATYADPWIPVAPASLNTLDDQQVSSLVSKVLAIYGDEDTKFGRYSQRLGDLADAEVVELAGGHAVYNGSPEEFVEVILEFLDLSSVATATTSTTDATTASSVSTSTPVSSPTALAHSNPSTSGDIQDVSVDNVPFYYCSAETTPAKKSLVLLHGSTFTRDTWLDNGIMQDLCSDGSLEVLAISRYGTDHEQLKSLLDSLEAGGYVSFPVALVTPSASSHPVVDWLANGDAQEMATYVDPWIPVAPASLNTLDDQQVSSLVSKVLAIYGDEDTKFGRYSQRLGELADAEVVELAGGHAVYNGSPEEFVEVILEFLDLSSVATATTSATTDATTASSVKAASTPVSSPTTHTPSNPSSSGNIKDLSVGNVPFYYCSAATTPAKKSLVLLHGSTFTRKIYLDNGIMQDLCSDGSLEVLAIELPVSAEHDNLKSLFDSLEAGGYVSFPVALVTPSASSLTVTSWLANGDAQDMATYADPWIPVAPVYLSTLDDQQVSSLVSNVLAIYGDEDTKAGRYSQRLGELADAEVVELAGGHAVYNGSPKEFVDVILGYLNV